MVYINEWFPNPAGPDADKEFIELFNSGSVAAELRGWRIETEKGKAFSLSAKTIAPRGYLLLWKRETKLSLRNSDGGLILFRSDGSAADRGAFYGAAPEGKSLSRTDLITSGGESAAAASLHFAFTEPSPGFANRAPKESLTIEHYPRGAPLNGTRLDIGGFFAIMVGGAALIASLILYVIKTNEDLSDIFFGGDESDR